MKPKLKKVISPLACVSTGALAGIGLHQIIGGVGIVALGGGIGLGLGSFAIAGGTIAATGYGIQKLIRRK